jgi:hypothetical protein
MAGTVYGQTPQIDAVSPTQNELNVAVNTSISVTFDIDMDAATINNSTFVVNSLNTGLHDGNITYNDLITSRLKISTMERW